MAEVRTPNAATGWQPVVLLRATTEGYSMKMFSRIVRSVFFFALLVAPVSVFAQRPAGQSETSYKVTIADPGHHIFHVAMRINHPAQDLLVKMPVWMQAIYEVHNYAEQVQDLRAHSDSGTPVTITSVDPHTWKLASITGPVIIEYDLDVGNQHKLSGKSYLEKQSGVING